MTQPIIFLDVDGVLNPETDANTDWSFTRVQSSWDIPLFLSHDMAAALWSISTDIRWATSWAHTEDCANPDIGAFFGWPKLPTPMIGYPRRFGNGSMWVKAAVVRDELANPGPPVVWIDDDAEALYALGVPDPHRRLILIDTDPKIGLTRLELDDIRVEMSYMGGWTGRLSLDRGRK